MEIAGEDSKNVMKDSSLNEVKKSTLSALNNSRRTSGSHDRHTRAQVNSEALSPRRKVMIGWTIPGDGIVFWVTMDDSGVLPRISMTLCSFLGRSCRVVMNDDSKILER